MKRIYLRTIAKLLVFTMCFAIYSNLFNISFYDNTKDSHEVEKVHLSADERSVLESVAKLVGEDNDVVQNMSDSVLQSFVESKVGDHEATQGQHGQPIKKLETETLFDTEKEAISINIDDHKDDYNEYGEMIKPFDEIYPELMDTDVVEYDEKTVLIKLSNRFDGKISTEMKKVGIVSIEKVFSMEQSSWYEAFLKKGTDTVSAIKELRKIKTVQLADYNYQITTTAMDDYEEVDANLTSNKLVAHQWHLNYCGFGKGSDFLDNPGGSPNVVVAVIDTGVDYDHEDLADNMWINEGEIPNNGIDDDNNGFVDDQYGVNIVAGKGNGDDDNGHGTHVAGIIAAKNNHFGTVGIAYNTKIMSVKAAMATGQLNSADIAKAINYAYENGAEVINMSFGGSVAAIAVQDALAKAYSQCVLVGSAGNDGHINEGSLKPVVPNYPAALSYVVGVMSVGRTGVESDFANFDNKLFTESEYEVYAPGEEILSTVPNNKYASWSGTSMSAPIVSAMAALIRSQYPNKSIYPSKFIYGQLTATSENSAICPGHQEYTIEPYMHNVPNIVNLHSALTKLPEPDIGLVGFDIFDSEGFESDTEKNNNGNGVVDAGETIALGVTLRNRWGMSKNTLVSIDTLSESGIPDPYIEIINPTVDYGSIGTYSTGDCGKIFRDELFVGWENPFYIKVSKDCPNNYIFRVNVNISCENALDENDKKIYKPEDSIEIELTVRNGYVLPSVIDDNMTLTKDNIYIIPNTTVINEGVTVKVEPGTHIQFWSDDPKDPYANKYISNLRVEGNFIVEGTADQPVYIYPSEIMSNYVVNFGEVNNGYISLKHTDITNYMVFDWSNNMVENIISYVDECIFRKNTENGLNYRYLSGGNVVNSSTTSLFVGVLKNVKNSVFYKINSSDKVCSYLYGNFENCAFVDCSFEYARFTLRDITNRFVNCLFYGNNFVSSSSTSITGSTYIAKKNPISNLDPSQFEIAYCQENGTTYVAIEGVYYKEIEPYFDLLGWESAVIETEDEYKWLRDSSLCVQGRSYDMGITNNNSGVAKWPDNSLVGDFIGYYPHSEYLDLNGGRLYNYKNYYCLLEFPGEIYVSDITFNEYEVNIDVGTDYYIKPLTMPVPLEAKDLIFESSDQTVVTVNEEGHVVPVSNGSADIYVYSKDRAVKNYVTVNVVDCIPLEGISFNDSVKEVEIGATCSLLCSFKPINTTRKNVTYISSNPEIVSIDESGHMTAKGRGEVVVTASCEGLTEEIIIKSYKKAEKLQFKELGNAYTTSQERVSIPELNHGDSDVNISYKSSDEGVVSVQNGELIINSSGVASIYAVDNFSGLSAETRVYVSSDTEIPTIKHIDGASTRGSYALFEDGKVYDFYNRKTILEDVIDLSIGLETVGAEDWFSVMQSDGKILYGTSVDSLNTIDSIPNVAKVFAGVNTYFAIDNTGTCYAWGSNLSNCSGTGVVGNIETPTKVALENVVDVFSTGARFYPYNETNFNNYTWFLTSEGELYLAGTLNEYAIPVLVSTNVSKIERYGGGYVHVLKDTGWHRFDYTYDKCIYSNPTYTKDYELPGFTIIDGVVRDFTTLYKDYVNGVTNVTKVFQVGTTCRDDDEYRTTYMIDEDNVLFAYGGNTRGQIDPSNSQTEYEIADVVLVPTFNYDKVALSLESVNLFDNVLKEESLVVDFNGVLNDYSGMLYADGKQIPCKTTKEFDTIKVSVSNGFKEGVEYRFVISPSNVSCVYLSPLADELTFEFTYKKDATVVDEEKEIHKAVVDEDVERFYYSVTELSKSANKIFEKYNPYFYNNVVLNRISTDSQTENWLKVVAPESSDFSEIPLGNNYWGTDSEKAIGLQLVDYTDFQSYAKFDYAPYLATPPENTFPFVTDIKIFNADGEEVTTVGREEITVRVTFNRDMDESIPLQVSFGSAVPYGDYTIEGQYVDARNWEGKIMLSSFVENGNQYFSISNGKAKGTNYQFYTDSHRFGFVIDTTSAQALVMQGSATDEGIELTWTQDDFDTLMGYNVYRSTSEDGFYQKLNDVIIPSETKTFFDDTVEPGIVYYYNFTVVKTDLAESTPSGKISVMSKDTMAPDIYHTPVYTAISGTNIIINATITDNVLINNAKVYYRAVGTEEWKVAIMNNLNSKYSAVIFANDFSIDGIEYYIEAFDGISYTCKGSVTNPYVISVQDAVEVNELGDVNGDGRITNLDALMLLQAINDILNLDVGQFARADLNGDGVLVAAEALRILQYVSGAVGSLKN